PRRPRRDAAGRRLGHRRADAGPRLRRARGRGGPVHLPALLRGARRDARRGRPGHPRGRLRQLDRDPRHRRRRCGRRAAARRRRGRALAAGLLPRERGPLLPPPRRHHRPVRRGGPAAPPGGRGVTDRVEELRRNLATVQHRITAACAAAGRDPAEITLIVVTKYFPVSDVVALADLGGTDIGENKDQEAAAKVAELPPAVRERLTVHFIGQLQTNKARSVARYADAVHSVDRSKLVRALDKATRAARDAGERTSYLPVLVQVDLGEGAQAGRGGAHPDEVERLAEEVAATEHLRLRGVMAVAPLGLDEDGT